MTSVLSVMAIVSCRYNSFSFTRDNIDNRMIVHSIHNSNGNGNGTIVSKYAPKLNVPSELEPVSKDKPKTTIDDIINVKLSTDEIVSSSDCDSEVSSSVLSSVVIDVSVAFVP